ncbi:ATP-binding protein [Kitasatospora sp. NPDC050543]|uniref:ATP-binding protein n=1 Tax=Kitasatospora sp. NPDC050543 TaxID=3364054 RepID=UPI003787BBF0
MPNVSAGFILGLPANVTLPFDVGEFEGYSELWLPSRNSSVRHARRHLRDLMAIWGAFDDAAARHFTEIGQLVLSELVTNAVRHAEPAVSESGIHVLFLYGEPGLQLSVSDGDAERLPTTQPEDTLGDHGRGLAIVTSLCAHWDCHPRKSRAGKTVRALIAPPAPPARQWSTA